MIWGVWWSARTLGTRGAASGGLAILTWGAMGIGCSPQADTHYRGEPLAVLRGQVITDGEPSDEELVAAVVWLTTHRQVGGFFAASAPLQGEFPASFQLELVEPPPEDAFGYIFEEGDQRTDSLVGVIAALPKRHLGKPIKEEDIAGVAMDHGVLYIRDDADIQYGYASAAVSQFNVPAEPGFHLFKVKREVDQEYLECRYGGLCVEVVPSNLGDDYDFERCLKTLDDPEVCTDYREPENDEQRAATQACSELWQEMRGASHECSFPWSHPMNNEGFDASVAISMGLSFQNWLQD